MSHSVLMQSVWRKPFIVSLEIWTIGLRTDRLFDGCKFWTVGPFDYYSVTIRWMTTPVTAVP